MADRAFGTTQGTATTGWRLNGAPGEGAWGGGAHGRPLRVLVVEDEAMVAMLLEDTLADLGCTIAASASRLEEGLRLARTLDIDLAVLDVNLGGPLSYPIADVLRERGIPFLFATGYGTMTHGTAYAHATTLQKPFRTADLARMIAVALDTER